MTYLLDTHALLWAIAEPEKLSEKAREILLRPDTHVVVSAVNLWEISLKYRLGKLEMTNLAPEQIPGICKQMDIEVLPLEPDTCATYHQLQPNFHKDPFDRMLIWFAIRHGYTLISKDGVLWEYEAIGLSVLW
jgi:PIN domain nuclease of toxin-antitoxin system